MNFDTNKEKGRSSLGIAIAYFSMHGYTVSIPLNDTFVCFGLSFLAESFGLASQGFAFLIIFLGTIGLIIVFCIFCCIFGGFGYIKNFHFLLV